MRETADVGHVIKAESAGGLSMWVSPLRGTVYVFGPRANAQVFGTRREANAVIAQLSTAFESRYAFSVEPVASGGPDGVT
jgi:hypothetical protein